MQISLIKDNGTGNLRMRHLYQPQTNFLVSQHSLMSHLLQLTCNCLSFDFIGTSMDESSDDLGTVQIPTSWRGGNWKGNYGLYMYTVTKCIWPLFVQYNPFDFNLEFLGTKYYLCDLAVIGFFWAFFIQLSWILQHFSCFLTCTDPCQLHCHLWWVF